MIKKEQRVFSCAMWLYRQHRIADHLLQEKALNVNEYEYSKVQYRDSKGKERYIGLRFCMNDVLNSPIFKDAYKLLVDNGMLEMDPLWDNPTHYKLLYDVDIENI